jgi:hypothetical protein
MEKKSLSDYDNQFKDKLRGLSKGKKTFIAIALISIFAVSMGIEGSKPKPDPCDCYSVFAKEEIMGFGNLSTTTQKEYNDCVSGWDNSKKANDGCLDKMNIK